MAASRARSAESGQLIRGRKLKVAYTLVVDFESFALRR